MTKWKTKTTDAAGKSKRSKGIRKGNVPDKASLSATMTMAGDGSNFGTNKLFVQRSANLGMFSRARAVAEAYQHYRIKKITMTFKPNLDTFAANSGSQKINLYYMIDKAGSVPANISLEGLKEMGAKAIPLDEKPIKVSYRPAVRTVEQTQLGASAAAAYRVSPWLATNRNGGNPGVFQPSDVEHWGIYFYAEQQGGGNAYTVDITAEFEFKKPAFTALLTDFEATLVVPAKRDTSSNGIVDDIE